MLVIFPLSPEATIRRLPLVTITIIIFTTIIFAFTYPRMIEEEREYINAYRELLEYETWIFSSYIVNEDGHIVERFEKVREKAEKGEIELPPPYKEKWEILKERVKTIEENMLIRRWGFIPSHITLRGMLLSLLLHAGFLHLFFNLYFLWLVGCNIEDDWGRPLFLALYVLSGIVACLFHALFNRTSSVPVIGASGAVSGIMGAFTIRHWNTKIRFFVGGIAFFRPLGTVVRIPAWIAFSGWFIKQVMGAFGGEGGVAFFAHIGGFLFGALAGILMKVTKTEEKVLAPRIEEEIDLVPYRFRQAMEELEKGNRIEFERKMKKFLEENPFYPDGWRVLAEYYRERGNTVELEKLAKEILSRARMENKKDFLREVYPFLKEEFSSLPPSDVIYIADVLWEKERRETIEFLERSYKKCKMDRKVLILLKLIKRMKEEGMDVSAYLEELEEKFPSYRGYV